MAKYLIHRLLGILPVLLLISLLVFGFVHLLPGDPARLVAGQDATQQDIAVVRAALGLDRPLWEQYVTYVWNILHGDFGISLNDPHEDGVT
jgi:glutathione transport system permease protein